MGARKRISKVSLIRVDSLSIENIKHPLHICPPFTLKYIQAFLQQISGYDIELIDLSIGHFSMDELLSRLSFNTPEVAVIFNEIFASKQSLRLASCLKKINNTFIIGIGPDISCRPEEYVFSDSPFDASIAGEAEEQAPLLIEKMNAQPGNFFEPPNYITKDLSIVRELDKLPFPQYSQEELRRYPFIYPLRFNKKINCGYIITGRGCHHNCLFCSPRMRNSYGRELRMRNAVSITDEIEMRIREGANFIYFADDNFTASSHHVISVCREIQRRNLRIKWSAQARIDEVDYESLKTMRDSGCAYLIFGVESGSNRINSLLNKSETKADWSGRCRETFKMAQEIGIDTCALFIIGSPTENRKEIRESIAFSKSLNPGMVKVHFFVPYPGSAFYLTMKNEIEKDTLTLAHHYAKPLVNFSSMSLQELSKMHSEFYKSFLLRPNFIFQHVVRYFFYYIYNYRHFIALVKGGLRILING